MKKLVSIVLALCMIALLLVGCGDKSSSNGGNGSSSERSSSGSTSDGVEKEEPVVIEWLAYDSYGQPKQDGPIVQYMKDRYNVDFNFWFLDDKNWNDSLNIKLATGDMPDIMRMKGDADLSTLVDQGIMAEIPLEMIEKNAPDYFAAINAYADTFNVWNYKMYEGKNYGLPKLNLGGKYPTILVWNEEWLEAIGYNEPPKTLSEFEDVMYKFRNNDPDGNGKKDTYGMSETTFNAIFGAFGIAGGNPIPQNSILNYMVYGDNMEICQTHPRAKEALALLQKWYNDGIIDPEFITKENTGGYWALSQAFMNERIGVTGQVMYYHYMPPEIKGDAGGTCYQEFMKVQPEGRIVASQTPIGPYGDQGNMAWGVAGEAFGITTQAMADPKKMEAIWKILNDPYADEEHMMKVSYGIEGEDYDMVDGVPISKNTDIALTEQRGVLVFLPNHLVLTTPKPASVLEYAEDVAGFTGYVSFPLPLGDARSNYATALDTIWKEAYIQLITGTKPMSYFDEFVEMFNKNGGTEVNQEIQAQYQEYK